LQAATDEPYEGQNIARSPGESQMLNDNAVSMDGTCSEEKDKRDAPILAVRYASRIIDPNRKKTRFESKTDRQHKT
jgi:hypothetical protein